MKVLGLVKLKCCKNKRILARLTFGLGGAKLSFFPRQKRGQTLEINESSLGVDARVTFLKADGVTPAKIDGVPTWALGLSPAGMAVGTLVVDPADPFHATITPVPVEPDSVTAAHTAQGTVSADGDLDAGEERLVVANFTLTVRRDEAQSAGISLTEIVPPTP